MCFQGPQSLLKFFLRHVRLECKQFYRLIGIFKFRYETDSSQCIYTAGAV